MTRTPNLFNPPWLDAFMLWNKLAVDTGEMLFSSGQVITARVQQIARAGSNPSQRDRREMLLMGSEKVKAATQSAFAVATGLQAANLQLATRAWQQWMTSFTAFGALAGSRSLGEALSRQHRLAQALQRSGHSSSRMSADAARLASAALLPVHAAATANARRLARLKRRSAASS
jgi:hypothetical protein